MDSQYIADTVLEYIEEGCYRAQEAILREIRCRQPFDFSEKARLYLAASYLDAYTCYGNELAVAILPAMAESLAKIPDDREIVESAVETFVRRAAAAHAKADIDLMADMFRERIVSDDTPFMAHEACAAAREDDGRRAREEGYSLASEQRDSTAARNAVATEHRKRLEDEATRKPEQEEACQRATGR